MTKLQRVRWAGLAQYKAMPGRWRSREGAAQEDAQVGRWLGECRERRRMLGSMLVYSDGVAQAGSAGLRGIRKAGGYAALLALQNAQHGPVLKPVRRQCIASRWTQRD